MFNLVFSPDDLNTTLFSQGYDLETALAMGMVHRMYIPWTREGLRGL